MGAPRGTHLVPTQNTTRHNALQRHTTTHNVNTTANDNNTTATIYHHHDMTKDSATHCNAPHNSTATRSNVPQGGARQKPALHNNGTQHATPQPNGSYTTPHNTAQCCTAQPTTKNSIKHGMAQPTPGTTRHHLTPHNETTQHTLRPEATPQPRDATQPNANQRGTT